MINLLLPPLYQQHYVAQPQPELYQPIRTQISQDLALTQQQLVNITESTTPNSSDAMQNESPLSDTDVQSITESSEITESQTERILEFKPVQKKQNDRSKLIKK